MQNMDDLLGENLIILRKYILKNYNCHLGIIIFWGQI